MDRIRVLVSKVGLDGHDRGAKVVAAGLRDAGMEVIYLGIRHSVPDVVRVALEEDVDVVGLSCLSGAHLDLFGQVLQGLREAGADDVIVVGGGTIPPRHRQSLLEMGLSSVFTPGTPMPEIVKMIRGAVQEQRSLPKG